MSAHVVAVAARKAHGVGKTVRDMIELNSGLGVAGDAHHGERVKHRSRARYNPSLPNLRQVHLIPAELLEDLAEKGFVVGPGDMGENVTTRGIDLMALPLATRLRIGDAVLELTGLRNPCIQLDRFMPGLMTACLDRDADGALVRKAGVMAIVVASGEIRAGDGIAVNLPTQPHLALKPV